ICVYGLPLVNITRIGMLPASLGLLMLALRNPNFGKGTILPQLGTMTLGVFCMHLILLDFLRLLDRFMIPWLWDIILPFLIYFGSIGLTLLMRKNPFTYMFIAQGSRDRGRES